MKSVLIILLAAMAPATASAEAVSGPATVVDGDTLTVDGRRVRLFGIDAPELRQPCMREGEAWACGEEAKRQLEELVGANPVACTGEQEDQYGRLIAICRSGRYELNATMVESGWAMAFRMYSADYVAHEFRAKAARQGIWRSTFDLPEYYRLAQAPEPSAQGRSAQASRPPARQSATSVGCPIKGNRNRRGQWIYHLPGMPYYDATRAEEMFCTETEAQAAGYRRAIVR